MASFVGSASGSPIQLTGLPAGSYAITVTSNNSVGSSIASAVSNTITVTQAGTAGPPVPIPNDSYSNLATIPTPLFNNTFWTQSGVSTARLHPNSAAIVSELTSDLASYGGTAAFNAHQFNTSIVIAPTGTTRVTVGFFDQQKKGTEPTEFANICASVPIPTGMVPSTGTDAEVTIIDQTNGDIYEFWQMAYYATATTVQNGSSTALRPAGWSACWGGKSNIYTGTGTFSNGLGASASGTVITAGVIGIREAQYAMANGHISLGHTLNMASSSVAPASAFQWPAQRGDGGSSSPSLIAEGQWFRLDPNLNVGSVSGMTPLGRVIARTIQTHGIIVTDQAGAVSIIGESPNQITHAGMTDPWLAMEMDSGGNAIPDYSILQNFPWSSLQALIPNWSAPTGHQYVYTSSGTSILENGIAFLTAISSSVATTLTSYLNYASIAPTAYTVSDHSIVDGTGTTVATGPYVINATRSAVILNANHAHNTGS